MLVNSTAWYAPVTCYRASCPSWTGHQQATDVSKVSSKEEAPAESASGANQTQEKLSRRSAHRARRLAVFAEWEKGGTFVEVGRKLGLTPDRTRKIVLK